MLISTAMVLFMTAPGLALFYGGLVRRKNVLSVLMQCIFLMGLMTIVWALWGYSLAFGTGTPWFGTIEHLFLQDVAREYNAVLNESVTPMSGTIPTLTFMLFQGMFFIITPALICGAFAERMKFSAMALFSVLWGTLVYCPLAHMVWSENGYLHYGAEGALLGGALDFAGGTVVHISSGVAALVAALLLGPRLGFGREPLPPHNLTYTAVGAAMLWFGWFGFNAGSALEANGLASSAFCATHFSAAAGAVTWALFERVLNGKPTVLGASSGAVAGLVCITPAAGYVSPMAALVIGSIGGMGSYWACAWLKWQFRYDDSLDAFGVHGIAGMLGAVLTGVFATREVYNVADGDPVGVWEGNWGLLWAQLAAIGVTILISGLGSYLLLVLVRILVGLRVTGEDEVRGLDVTDHGEEGYLFI
jgi:Amt family ammonium transporter